MRPPPWKIGELARMAGVSVRTLHHYDEIGLLSPSARTDSGHRLYGEADVARLQRVMSLRQLGFALEEIRDCLDLPDFAALPVIQRHLCRLREQIEIERGLCARLEAIGAALRAASPVPVEQLIQTIEVISMLEEYYTPQQLAELQERRRTLGEERIRQVEAEWPRLIAEVRAELERGTDPAAPAVQTLAQRWMSLIHEFTGGNPEIEKSLGNLYRQEPGIARQHGCDLDPQIVQYVGKAIAAAKAKP